MVCQNHKILEKTKRQRPRKQQKRRNRQSEKRRANNVLLALCLPAFQGFAVPLKKLTSNGQAQWRAIARPLERLVGLLLCGRAMDNGRCIKELFYVW